MLTLGIFRLDLVAQHLIHLLAEVSLDAQLF